MADSKISALSAITSFSAADQLAVARAGASDSIRADHMPGFERDYVERTTSLTITGTTEGGANSWIDGNAVSYDGSTRIKIEAWANDINTTTGTAVAVLIDGSTAIGWLCEILGNVSGGTAIPFYGVRFLTPSNASHTYHVKWWKTGGTASVNAGSGGAGADMPAWLRITVA